MAALIAWGTIVESRYQDAQYAKRVVYQSVWMYLVFGVFALNLLAVMIDRIPWKRRHVPFLLAHAGIIILLLGSVLTYQFGVDGNLRLPIQDKGRYVYLSDTILTVWSSFDGDRFTKILEKEVDFYRNPPQKSPLVLPTDKGNIEVTEWHPYAIGSRQVRGSSNEASGAAIQFTIRNSRVNVLEWLVQSKKDKLAQHDFGPARIHLGADQGPSSPLKNEMYIEPLALLPGQKLSEAKFRYTIYSIRNGKVSKGQIQLGEALPTGWMDLEFKIIQFLPLAEEYTKFSFLDYKTDMTNGVLKLKFQNQDHWLQQNDVMKLFTDSSVYYVSFAQKRLDLGFDLTLNEFKMDRYPGTQRAATYQSTVEIPEGDSVVISMNEPLKYKGYTFYQASFQQGPDGALIASILSVNHDPGRFLKYLGSFILSLGVIVLFYDKRKAAKAQLAPISEDLV
jgi:hypothetical protein